MAKPPITKLLKIEIKKFRGLDNVHIDIANRITLICGKNGTSKSSILGIAAQVFSFRMDYTKNTRLSFKTLSGDNFKSQISEHFRLSKRFDTSGSMDTLLRIHDGYTDSPAEFSLKLYNSVDRAQPRPVVRGNTSVSGTNSSRNATHPVIYLSLKRLMPISLRDRYTEHDLAYLENNKSEFLKCTQEILGKFSSTQLTATAGTIPSVAAHSDEYDQDSVSAGEDNIGQILMAVFSFRKLKEEYPDYKGGLLLIDEADAGLFPAAQLELLKFLNKECKALNLQVIMTSHSPTMIEEIHATNKSESSDNKTIYLTDSYGSITAQNNFSWPEIYADLHQKTVAFDNEVSLPLVNTYFEDRECADLFSAIITSRTINKAVNKLKDVALGCSEYIKLIERKIPEFAHKSIVVLDGDVEGTSKYPSVILLPSQLPPDQLIFEFLFNLPATDEFWKNKAMYTRLVFLKSVEEIRSALKIPAGAVSISMADLADAYQNQKTPNKKALRVIFKDFAHNADFLKMVNGPVGKNPYRMWAKQNPVACDAFRDSFEKLLRNTLTKGFGVDTVKLAVLG
jgi:AAA15 family ATPase/GTPase